MNKNFINNYLRKIGVELHGIGYIKKLKSTQKNKDSFLAQQDLLNGSAKIIFDVGANKGLTTLEYLKLFPAAQIHSFEPFTDFFQLWDGITMQNKNVVFNPMGVSDKSGEVTFNINSNPDTNSILASKKIDATSDNNCKTISTSTIRVTTIDEYCANNSIHTIDILKIDTQGSELNILKGMENMLKSKSVKLIFTETYFQQQYENQPLLYDIANYLSQFGYYLQDMYDPFYNDTFLLWCDTIFLPKA